MKKKDQKSWPWWHEGEEWRFRIPYLITVYCRRGSEPFNLVTKRFEAGQKYVGWVLGFGKFMYGGWWPSVYKGYGKSNHSTING